jgi:hypothetical protein
MFSTRLCALALAAIGLAGSRGPGFAQAGDDFYKGKQLSVMIGYGAGGSDDLWARIISRHIGEYIPGHPTIVPVNAPGARSPIRSPRTGPSSASSIAAFRSSRCSGAPAFVSIR